MELNWEKIDKVLARAFDYDAVFKKINRSEAEVNQLRKLVDEDKSIPPCVTNKHLLVFLANDLSIEDVFAKVKLFFQLKMNSPEVFRNRSPYSNEISRTFENQNFLYLPVTPDGYSVVYSSLKNYSVSTFDLNSLAKAFFMTAEACFFNQGPQKGIIFLVDMMGGKLFHLTKVNLKTIKMGLKFAMDGCPQKIIAFHILNAVPFYDLIMQIMRPFSRKELRLLLHLHYANIDWDHFYANHIPRSSLPSNYGGDLESVEELSKKTLGELKSLSDYYDIEEDLVFKSRKIDENDNKDLSFD